MWRKHTEHVGEDDARLAPQLPRGAAVAKQRSLERWVQCTVEGQEDTDMTILAPARQPATSWAAPTLTNHAAVADVATRRAVLRITGMPKRQRAAVERAMAVCLRSEPEPAPWGTDPLTAQWCTRWEREASSQGAVLIGCRQAISGTSAEIDRLQCVLDVLSGEYGFQARVDVAPVR